MNVLANELARFYEEISPYDFYRSIFPEGELDEADAFTKGKACAIAIEVTDKKRIDKKTGRKVPVVYRHTVTDDLDVIDELQHSPHFCIMSPISYVGKQRVTVNAKAMYALCVELDNLIVTNDGYQLGLENLMHRYSEVAHYIPKPTFVVASGSGLHLYYQFDRPLMLFPNTIQTLKRYKEELTRMIWTKSVTTTHTEDTIQQESAFQPFRMPGTKTKAGDRAVAFCVGKPVTIEYMNSFLRPSLRAKCSIEGVYKNDLRLADAKEKYPEWYEKVIVNKDKSRKEWALSRNVYDWWLREIKEGATDGHRFYCLKMLAIYAIKCSNYDEKKNPNPVTEEEFEADVWSLFEDFKARGKRADNPFTEHDIMCALQVYSDRGMITYPRTSIANRSGIQIEPQIPHRKKPLKRDDGTAFKAARAMQNIIDPEGRWRNKDGRPKNSGTAQSKVQQYRAEHPEASVTEAARALGISRTTVYKWWT